MNIAFYNAYTAMKAYQQSLDVVSHNLANVSTVGYKETKSTFQDLLYSRLDQNGDHTMLRGHGVMLSSVDKKFELGNPDLTNHPLDFMITQDGFFAVQTGEDEVVYTRAGAFRLGEEDGTFYLTRLDGAYVLDKDLQRIEIPKDETSKLPIYDGIGDKIGVFRFTNQYELAQAGVTSYLPTEKSGEAEVVENSRTALLQGALEMSSTSMTDEMVAMMESQRAFQLNARMIQTADQIEEMVNNLR